MARRSGPREPTAEEIRLWRQAMQSAKPLRNNRNRAPELPPLPENDPGEVELPVLSPAPLRFPERIASRLSVRSQPLLEHGKAPGVDKKTADRLRQGERTVEATLDLHGYTGREAHEALGRFLRASYDLNRRCVLVITGKGVRGDGLLRGEVPRWLNAEPLRGLILAFSYAQPKDGGSGALYVLIKRRR